MLYDNVKFSKRINKLFIMSTRDLIHYRADDAKIPSRYWPFCVIIKHCCGYLWFVFCWLPARVIRKNKIPGLDKKTLCFMGQLPATIDIILGGCC